MKDFHRDNPHFSLCGLNCALCPMFIDRYCPGCGGGAGNQACAIAKCSLLRGGVAYCCECGAFPCEKHAEIDVYDSFITHVHRQKDFERFKALGASAYNAVQIEKAALLDRLLQAYNDGRRKRFFCLAVNLLELRDLRLVMKDVEAKAEAASLSLKERAAAASSALQAMADQRGLTLKLRVKPKPAAAPAQPRRP